MKKTGLLFVAILMCSGVSAFADDGEGLPPPPQGTCGRTAYNLANEQYMKDDGNPSYHYAGERLLDGGRASGFMSIEVDLESDEDGEYTYKVDFTYLRSGACQATGVTRVDH